MGSDDDGGVNSVDEVKKKEYQGCFDIILQFLKYTSILRIEISNRGIGSNWICLLSQCKRRVVCLVVVKLRIKEGRVENQR